MSPNKASTVLDGRKKAVSIRMQATDVRKVKRLAQRLGARDSDVIRFAVKAMLARLAPLYDPEVRGKGLVPVFVESGADLVRFFDLDVVRLEAIINDDVDASRKVSHDDLALIAMSGSSEPYARLHLAGLVDSQSAENPTLTPEPLKSYLYDKYVYRQANGNGRAEAANGQGEPERMAASGVP